VPKNSAEEVLKATQAKNEAEVKQFADIEAGKVNRTWVDDTLKRLGCAME